MLDFKDYKQLSIDMHCSKVRVQSYTPLLLVVARCVRRAATVQ